MPKPKIAVDLDDVLSASADAFVRYSNQRWGTTLTIDDYDERWGVMWQTDQEETQRRAIQVHEAHISVHNRPFDQALPVLRRLSRRYVLDV